MSLDRFKDENGNLVVGDEMRDYIAHHTPLNEQPNTNFTRMTFATKKEADDYISSRSINPYDDYGRLKPGVDLTKQDGLFLKVGHSLGAQPDGTWLLIF
jgi:hypothetical protein